MSGKILTVNLAVPMRSTAKNVGITGINKRPVDRPVEVRAPGPKTTGLHSGLVGDQIFDVAHHGGDDQAVSRMRGRTWTGGSRSSGASCRPGCSART